MGKKYLTGGAAVIVIAGLLLAGCGTEEKAREEAPLVRTQVVRMGGAGQPVSYSGEVRGRYESQLAFQVGGKIVRRAVELGSAVNPGDTLLEIDPKDISQAVAVSAAQVYSAESQLKLAENNLHRYRQLYEQAAVSRAQYEQYQNAYDAALAAARQASAQHAQTSNQLGYSVLRANGAGVISAVNAEVGQVVSAGQAVVTLVRDGEREVEIDVPENRGEELRKAGKISVNFWALPGVALAGKVREVAPMADKVSRTYKVRVSLPDCPPEVKLGMTATVTVTPPASGNGRSAYIPLAAVYQTGDSPCVWVVDKGAVVLRKVRLGAFGDGKVEVAEGLADGETIVTAGVHKLREGLKVRTGDGL
ncbi:efflux RND transporter periplasmic adaptor subunit [Anaeroselena agilis]|uniref:Efflux RND transporter periplasmic adaptor subunit n=1 Tax=Anaeroselena agilis TaxID=3063788 RepID=A0ABU3NTN9_9FIRM|nr:efflux RND transporter periplasmic adaptor subunit [Selenomonadales bacterium 4137-cl]